MTLPSIRALVFAFFTAAFLGLISGAKAEVGSSQNIDQGWRLWLDEKAPWKNDTLYLPEEADLSKLPVNAPTGGWDVLNAQAGIPVSLPDTTEAHYWGKSPNAVADPSKPSEVVNLESPYLGVSWWYRPFTPPALKPGERLIFYFPAGRLRVEVYVNGKLEGYNIITETPLTVDATDALKPGGPNLLAVRITNPGGNFAWQDFKKIAWGKYGIPGSHGFGGLSGGVTMSVQGPVSVTDLAVLNNPDPRQVTLIMEVSSTGDAYDGPLALGISQAGKEVWKGSAHVHVPAHGLATVWQQVRVADADLWDVGHPALYQAEASIPSIAHSDRSTTFGFHWFTAKGIGDDAKLYLNDRRIVVRSAISFGFWAPNGMFPDQAAVDRDISSVQAIGLNCIQNHRHMPKAIVLDGFDRAGLLRYCEPGGGCFTIWDGQQNVPSPKGPVDTSGAGGEPTTFYNRYEEDKVLSMVRAFRSHPSIPIWCLQNEIKPDLTNPKIFYTLRKIHEIDPSRIVLLKSGSGHVNQAWALPYSNDFMHDDGTGVSGWWDDHTANASVAAYFDSDYKTSGDFLYRSDDKKEIVEWGEMATGASADDHAAIVKWYQDHHTDGYDRAAHQTLLDAYNKFLDAYDFRSAFPAAEDLFRSIGAKHYFLAAKLMENARICNVNDYIVLSGWETTTVDDHCGMVDALRQLKSDPAQLKQVNASELLVIRPHRYVIAKGDAATVDIHLVNETNRQGAFIMQVSASQNGGRPFYEKSFPVTVSGGEVYGELLKDNIDFTPPGGGAVTITANLAESAGANPFLSRSEQMFVVDTKPAPIRQSVAYLGYANGLADILQKKYDVRAARFTENSGLVDRIIIDTADNPMSSQQVFKKKIVHATDAALYAEQTFGIAGPVAKYDHLTPGQLKVDLYFTEPFWTQPGQRVFDVALNGQTVLKNFDLVKEAGGAGRSVVRTFSVNSLDGVLNLSVPTIAKNKFTIAAIRISDSHNHVINGVFRAKPYMDPDGVMWNPVPLVGFDWKSVLPSMLDRVRAGARLILIPSTGNEAGQVAAALADARVLTYTGEIGPPPSSWSGFWYFGKKHWLLDGLPSNCVMDWPYQIENGDGLSIQAPGLEGVIGFGRDHDPKIGLGAVIPVGKGQIVLFCMPGLGQTLLQGSNQGFALPTAERLLYNALN
jgi:hypothetical protein